MKQLLSLFVILSATASAGAEPIGLDLWPQKAPGDVGIEGGERTRMYESPLLDRPTKLITNVSRPTLTVYPASKEINTGTAMIICPGGGYHDLFWELEGEEVATWLNKQGMTGIILKYRVPRRPGDAKGEPPLGPLIDAQRAVSLVRSRCREWGVDEKRIGIVGFSAGGHLAVATAANFDRRRYEPLDDNDQASCRPDFAVACYSGYFKAQGKNELSPTIHIARIPAEMPPVLLAHASDDKISDPEHSVIMYLALKRAEVPVELHVFASGNHDFGVRHNDKLPSIWPQLCLRWLRTQGLLTPPEDR